ncbi:hypothetical protein MVEN_02145400 [Mycena venus]|uniref:Uncharacterized protein n=1 Tax=Mycena venus TaxID=2733690 RepID=A0A8H6X9T1_9AGAR|nr:hypothetical protein MVEN_02145400 [Mycena venus]
MGALAKLLSTTPPPPTTVFASLPQTRKAFALFMLLLRPKIWALRTPLNQLFLRARYHISRTRSSQNPVIPVIPELFSPNFLDELIPPTSPSKKNDAGIPPTGPKSHPMMDALRESAHRTFTENVANAYDSTLSPTVDAFHKLTHFSYGDKIGKLLDNAWAEDSELTLKIIWNLRSIHDGKSEKEGFYRAFGWLYDNHPRTAITNLHLLVEPVCLKPDQETGLAHGYWKDLLNILALATVDELSNISQPSRFLHTFPDRKARTNKAHKASATSNLDELGIKVDLKPVIKAQRAVLGAANHARVERKLADPKYRALYVAVARLFAQRLLTDWRLLLESETAGDVDARKTLLRNISLAPKWAPSLLGTHDRHTNITTAISRLIYHAKDAFPTFRFPTALKEHESMATLDSAEATGIMRSFYRRWILTPLRAASLVTETFMSANRWKEIPYSRVSAVCMKNNNKHFFTHDPDGFQKYLISVEKGTRTISGASLLPHELVAEVCRLSDGGPDGDRYPELRKHRLEMSAANLRVVEAQWRTLVQNLRNAGTIDNAIAVCDVSGSMGSLPGYTSSTNYNPKTIDPILPAISLSLLLAQLAKPPFNGGFITFSHDPKFVRLDPAKGLRDTIQTMELANWGMNTDIGAVFLRLLLPLALENEVKPEDVIKRVFVFSDMQEFRAAGYDVPEIVYWNLSNYDTVEVLADRKGVALMSGFSPSMLKVFIGEEVEEAEPEESDPGIDPIPGETKAKTKTEFNPLNVMKKALARPSFDGLVVVD